VRTSTAALVLSTATPQHREELLHHDQAATLQTEGRNEGVQRKDKGRQSSKPHTSAQKLTLLLRRKWTDY
jgi:hypothetical protein